MSKCLINAFNSQTYSIKPDKSMDYFFKHIDEKHEGYLKDPNKMGKEKCVFYTNNEYLNRIIISYI